MAVLVDLFFLFCFFVTPYAVTLSSHITETDKSRLMALFNNPSLDLDNLSYASLGLQVLNGKFSDNQKVCEVLKKSVKPSDAKSIFHSSIVANHLKKSGSLCQINWENSEKTLTDQIKEDSSSEQLLFSIVGLANLGKSIPKSAEKFLKVSLKKDDSPLSYGQVFLAASHLQGADLKYFVDLIEDVVAQADEINNEFLQFDSGVATTALVVYSSQLLCQASNLKLTISDDKIIKLANYLVRRKDVHSVIEASLLINSLVLLSSSKNFTLATVTLVSPIAVSEQSPYVSVKVSNLIGEDIDGVSLVADSARHISDNAVILSKQSFQAKPGAIHELNLKSLNPAPGFYKILLFVSSSSSPLLLANQDFELVVKVITEAELKKIELLVQDKEQGNILKTWKLNPFERVEISSDYHQRIILKFSIQDKQTKKPISAHQTFVRLMHKKTSLEVTYVAELEDAETYKFDLDVDLKAKEFNGLSGLYKVDLIVGDAIIHQSITWHFADLTLKFSESHEPKRESLLYSKKPEIKHIFREPDQRPPAVVSSFFTVLTLVPFFFLFVFWLKIGVNFSNFPVSLFTLGFHLGLGAIFVLYFLYFVRLNMFETLKYLAIIGLFTFVCGQRVLSTIAANRK